MIIDSKVDIDAYCEGKNICVGYSGSVMVVHNSSYIMMDYLDFDSKILGEKTYRITAFDVDDADIGCLMKELKQYIVDSSIGLVTCRLSADRLSDLNWLEKYGFCVIENLMQYELSAAEGIQKSIDNKTFDFFCLKDEAQYFDDIVLLGKSVFVSSRYHLDTVIDNDKANQLKGEWVRNAISDGVKDIIVAVDKAKDKAIGFLIYKESENSMIIDLIGVDSACRGQGVGSELIQSLINVTTKSILVGTQSLNIASQNMYIKKGFKVKSSFFTLHYHQET